MLYLVQHAEAEWKEKDPDRPLTKKGLRDIERVSLFVAEREIQVSRILHSGKTRAAQTAEVLGRHVRPSAGIRQVDGLRPKDSPEIIASQLTDLGDLTALVGHLPHLERLAGLLLCGNASKKPIGFRNAGMVALEAADNAPWFLAWIVTPDILP